MRRHVYYLASMYQQRVKSGTIFELRCKCGIIHVIPDSQIPTWGRV